GRHRSPDAERRRPRRDGDRAGRPGGDALRPEPGRRQPLARRVQLPGAGRAGDEGARRLAAARAGTGPGGTMRVVGVDIGGTFTDFMLYDTESGSVHVHKVPSTPDAPERAMVNGLGELCGRAGLVPGDVTGVFHGTTIATNALLEHEGAVAGMITTRGFRDVVHIGRHQRPLHYSVMQDIPWQARPLVRRRHRKVVTERVVPPSGEVLVPLDEDEVRAAARELREEGVEAVAVCFLFSYLNPEHERRAAAIVREEM